nr:cyclic-di-AMP receptor [uncultured Cellulosilyticum sp.]
MAGERKIDKLIIAILQSGDYEAVVSLLNKRNICATKISSSGGFLKKENVTIMMGIEAERLEEAIDILRRKAGKRKQTQYTTLIASAIYRCPEAAMTFPVEMEAGGVTIFVMDVSQYKTF